MKSSATRTVIFGLFVATGRRLTASQVIALARPLRISASNVKSHLTRMVAEGALERSGPARLARYWPSDRQRQVVEGITARLQGSAVKTARATRGADEQWNGHWLMLALRMPVRRAARDRLKMALWFDGFRPWNGDTWIRPAWPKPWAQERANACLGHAPGLCVQGVLLTAIDLKQVAHAYRLDSLDREASRLAQWIRDRPIGASPSKAFAERLRVGGMVARLVGHDPRLPTELWGQRAGLHELVREFHHFEERTRLRAERFVDQVLSGLNADG
jgi:DNA-binding transcriptional regulator PaaX